MMQHWMGLTLAETIQQETGNSVRLLAQDPGYTDTSKAILADNGFAVVGECGAAGFAEVDEDTVVVSVAPDLPVNQIIADIARPALFITFGQEAVLNCNKCVVNP